jgi:hypothetical protein
MADDEITQAEAVRRAIVHAEQADELIAQGHAGESKIEIGLGILWTRIASQLPLVPAEQSVAVHTPDGKRWRPEDVQTEFIPRVVEPLAVPLCYCAGGLRSGHLRGALCE